MSDSQWVIEPTAQTFEAEVIERSNDIPIVVDFWAPWCGPCRQLGPVLESLADEYGGRFLLAKVNTEDNPQLAAAFRVQSIPFVVAVKDRQLVDQFVGLLPETALRDWLNRLMPSPAEELVQEAQRLEGSDAAAAESRYREALTLDSDLAAAKIGLARLLETQGRYDEVRELIDQLEQRGFLEPEAERIKSALAVESVAAASGGVEAARAAAQADPGNLSLKISLAEALAAAGQHADGLELCLEVIQSDKTSVGVQAKEAMLNILNLTDDPELVAAYRRRLASALY